MNWIKITLIAFFVVGAISTVFTIGAPRKPITPGIAVVQLIVSALLIWAVVVL